MKIYKGNIITCDSKNTVAKYLVEHKGKIVYVGDSLPDKYSAHEIDLGSKALLPSFADTHIHFASFAIFNSCPNIRNVKNNAELLGILKEYAAASKQKFIMAFGASAHSVEEKRLITRAELDDVSSTKPIMIVKYDGHASVVNQALIDLLGDDIKALRGFDAQSGEMKQEAFFAISDFATKSISPVSMVKNMQKAVDAMAEKGIGKFDTVSGVGFPRDMDVDLERIIARSVKSGFQIRVFFQTMDIGKVLKRKLPRVGGCFATALDGSFGSMDAAVLEPYEGTDNKGVLFYSDEQVSEFCIKANRAGLQIEMHAIGDAAFGQAARALKAALDDCPRSDHRHGIIHAYLPTAEGLKICAEYGIQLPMQTACVDFPLEPGWYLESILGRRAGMLNPIKTFLNNGLVLSLGSDSPVTIPDPLAWIHGACNRLGPGQSITVAEALKMATYNGYRTTFDEKERGSLEAGKVADMVILSESPYDVPLGELDRIKVEKLILSGKPYKKQKQNIARLLVKGLLSKRKV